MVAIAAYRCEVAGRRTESLDIQVRFFADSSQSQIEERIRSETAHQYLNDRGDLVSWPLVQILSIAELENPKDGAEIAGFITGCDEFTKWATQSA
jgi:hypothetical protein